MIRKFARMKPPPELLVGFFSDTSRWPRWMPGVVEARTIRRTMDSELVNVTQDIMGRRFRQRFEHRIVGQTVRQRQVKGVFKGWRATWSFDPAPERRGTTLCCELDFDLGMMGMMMPTRAVQREIDRIFEATVAGAERELRHWGADRDDDHGEAPLLEVYPSQHGLEVWIAGKRVARC